LMGPIAMPAPMARDPRLQRIEAVIDGSSVCLRKAIMIASSSMESTYDLGSRGPVGRSATDVRRFQLATVFWLAP
jgi:hypothetical protein